MATYNRREMRATPTRPESKSADEIEYERRRARRRARWKAQQREARRRRVLRARIILAVIVLAVVDLLAVGIYMLFFAQSSAPIGVAHDLTVLQGDAVEASAFVSDIPEAEDVTVTYKKEPDFDTLGTQMVTLVLKSTSHKKATLTAAMNVVVDTEAPKIEGAEDIMVNVGETVSYKNTITYTDNVDTEDQLTLTVDNSSVDLDTAGTYQVTYTVTDRSGNVGTATINVIVAEESADEASAAEEEKRRQVTEKAEEIIASLKTEGQTDRELLLAMFLYVDEHMSYTGTSDKTKEASEAYRGMTEGVGDCYTYFAFIKALMNTAGFETVDVTRLGGTTHHYWNLVKVDGNWYHIDTCERSVEHYKTWYCFLRTDEEVNAFSDEMVEGYYDRDLTLYPSTPTTEEAGAAGISLTEEEAAMLAEKCAPQVDADTAAEAATATDGF